MLWDLADEVGVTLFGTSAKYLDTCRQLGLRPAETHDLGSVRTITSTGSPLVPEGFEYVYDAVKADVHLASISGGTDLCGCLVAGDPTGPVWAGEIQRPGLGHGDRRVRRRRATARSRGRPGSWCARLRSRRCRSSFWDDPGDARYRAAYFERFPGVVAPGRLRRMDRRTAAS